MSVSWLVLELWQFLLIKDWPKTWKSEIPPAWVLPNIWRLGRIRNTKLGTNVSNTMLLHAAKCQSYSFYRFWLMKGKPTGGIKLPPPKIWVKNENSFQGEKNICHHFQRTFSCQKWTRTHERAFNTLTPGKSNLK